MQSAPVRGVFCVTAAAGLAGAAGVALAAVAAHRVESPALATAATMLVIHAAAAVAIAAHAANRDRPKPLLLIAALMLAAAALFAGDIALNALTGAHIFPRAAPTGGTGMIAAWLALAVYAVFTAFSARQPDA